MASKPHQTHFRAHLDRLRLMVQRAMRRTSDRYLQADGTLSDQCVGPQELRRLLGVTEAVEGQVWLDRLGVAPALAVDEALLDLEEVLDDLATDAVEPLPIEVLCQSFGLSPQEFDLLLAAAAPRLSRDMARLYAVAWADFAIRQPTAGFLAELVADSDDRVDDVMALMADGAPLIRHRLLVPAEHALWKPMTPRLHAPMMVPDSVLAFVRGRALGAFNHPGCELHAGVVPLDDLILADDVRAAIPALKAKPRGRVCLLGAQGSGRRTLAAALAGHEGGPLLEIGLSRVFGPKSVHLSVELAELLREARLHRAALLFRLDDMGDHPALEKIRTQAPELRALVDGYPWGVFASARDSARLARVMLGELVEVALEVPGVTGQKRLWEKALSRGVGEEAASRLADQLSKAYRLPPGAIQRAAQSALDGRRSEALDAGRLIEAVRRQFDHNLGWLADVIASPVPFEDVVLAPQVREKVHEVLVFARHSEQVFQGWGFASRGHAGSGLSVMFSGPPGTGKTLMAGALARELGRTLYRVDLSRIVDKYIGETEKNLGRVFDEAARAQAVLLFDEADSLFATRTSVKSSNDRYANLEVNYLLQRLEGYSGVSILTTNFATSIDEAFQRRIRFKIEFPMPDPELRAELWRTLQPPGAPLAQDIDWAELGQRYEFSGGHVRNAILRAAVHAAELGQPIGAAALHRAAVAESREMGLLISDDAL